MLVALCLHICANRNTIARANCDGDTIANCDGDSNCYFNATANKYAYTFTNDNAYTYSAIAYTENIVGKRCGIANQRPQGF